MSYASINDLQISSKAEDALAALPIHKWDARLIAFPVREGP